MSLGSMSTTFFLLIQNEKNTLIDINPYLLKKILEFFLFVPIRIINSN